MPTITRTNDNTSPQRAVHIEQSEQESLEPLIQTVDNNDVENYAKDLAFMEELVEVRILPSYNQEDTTRLVEITVNGRSFYFLRGEWTKCPRYVLEILATAKKQAWTFGFKQAPNGVPTQTSDAQWLLRYPHQFRDMNPKGVAWYDSIKDNVR